jgi:5-methyltetrahydropteroyltriglutamate--homocysteine methyltransferase
MRSLRYSRHPFELSLATIGDNVQRDFGFAVVQHSQTRILTTHAGSLPRPTALSELHAAQARGETVDAEQLARLSEGATRDAIARQLELGLDVINNGEAGRESFLTYVRHRMSGFGGKSERRAMGDLLRYPDYLAQLQRARSARQNVSLLSAPQAIGAVGYVSPAAIEEECAQLERLLEPHRGAFSEAFMSSPSPGIIAAAMQNAFYDDLDAYVDALADALRTEYHAIVARGFVLQIDAPDLALERHTLFQDKPLADFLDFARVVVRAINRALGEIPPSRVRLHVCWGNYEGAHDLDVALQDIWPEIAKTHAGAFLISMANPRHCHEYHVFESGCLPRDTLLIPGVIDTTTNYVEHPHAVADRLLQIAVAVGDPTRLIAGTDCGLETSAGTSMVVPDIAWAKLRSLVQGARIASDRLFG